MFPQGPLTPSASTLDLPSTHPFLESRRPPGCPLLFFCSKPTRLQVQRRGPMSPNHPDHLPTAGELWARGCYGKCKCPRLALPSCQPGQGFPERQTRDSHSHSPALVEGLQGADQSCSHAAPGVHGCGHSCSSSCKHTAQASASGCCLTMGTFISVRNLPRESPNVFPLLEMLDFAIYPEFTGCAPGWHLNLAAGNCSQCLK